MAVRNRYRFLPGQIETLSNVIRFTQDNFRRISDAMLNLEQPVVPSRTSPPDSPEEGTLVIADGTSWNPGAGAGTYIYRSGQWRKLD